MTCARGRGSPAGQGKQHAKAQRQGTARWAWGTEGLQGWKAQTARPGGGLAGAEQGLWHPLGPPSLVLSWPRAAKMAQGLSCHVALLRVTLRPRRRCPRSCLLPPTSPQPGQLQSPPHLRTRDPQGGVSLQLHPLHRIQWRDARVRHPQMLDQTNSKEGAHLGLDGADQLAPFVHTRSSRP